jgi:hypothetical protein
MEMITPTRRRKGAKECKELQQREVPFLLLQFFAFLCAFAPALILLAGCVPAPPPTATPPPTTAPIGSCTFGGESEAGDEAQIRALLRAESSLMVSQQIDALMALWAEEGRVVNAKNTPNDEGDDQLWLGKDAVRHRYVRTVFPGAPTAAAPADMEIAIAGESAVVTSTTQIGGELSVAGDRWQLRKLGGCWVIERLTYNLEPAYE